MTICREIRGYVDALENVKTRDKSMFLTTFAWKIRKNKARFEILVQFNVDMY